jgi:2-dehydropantoate 2-reductase
MSDKKILVIGLGPGGGILAAYMAANGRQVYGLDTWREHAEEIKTNGLKLSRFISLNSRFREVCTHIHELQETNFDYVVIAVKTPFMAPVLKEVKNLPGDFKLVIAQNGIDNEEDAIEYFSRDRILRMALHYAGNILSPGAIQVNFFQKPNRIGCLCRGNESENGNTPCNHSAEFAAILTEAGLETVPVPDIRKYTWKKGILNAILAPIAALLGVTMADVMANKGTRQIVESLIKESIIVAGAAGYDYGEGFFDECVNFLLNAGPHKPSMLIDLENGNPTEIDYINGKIVEFAQKYNIPAPFNMTITGLVKAKESFNKKMK